MKTILRKIKEEVKLAEASANTTWRKLQVALKQKAAATESEKLALATAKALQESEQAAKINEAEELAYNRLAAALAPIDEAKISQIKRLKEAYRELEQRKELLKVASEKLSKQGPGRKIGCRTGSEKMEGRT